MVFLCIFATTGSVPSFIKVEYMRAGAHILLVQMDELFPTIPGGFSLLYLRLRVHEKQAMSTMNAYLDAIFASEKLPSRAAPFLKNWGRLLYVGMTI